MEENVINFEQVGCSLPDPKPKKGGDGWSVEGLCKNQYFSTDRYHLEKDIVIKGLCDGSSLEIWGLLSGSIVMNGELIDRIRFILLPASMGSYEIRAKTTSILLRTYAE